MKFLADEGVDAPIVKKLRENGFDVSYIAEMEPNISDEEVLERANQDKRILLTLDKDFGELVFRKNAIHHGIILIRLPSYSPIEKAEMTLKGIQNHSGELPDAFSVFQEGIIRIRKR